MPVFRLGGLDRMRQFLAQRVAVELAGQFVAGGEIFQALHFARPLGGFLHHSDQALGAAVLARHADAGQAVAIPPPWRKRSPDRDGIAMAGACGCREYFPGARVFPCRCCRRKSGRGCNPGGKAGCRSPRPRRCCPPRCSSQRKRCRPPGPRRADAKHPPTRRVRRVGQDPYPAPSEAMRSARIPPIPGQFSSPFRPSSRASYGLKKGVTAGTARLLR